MYLDGNLYIAHCDDGPINLVGKMCNRHGLIAGATGTGKTVLFPKREKHPPSLRSDRWSSVSATLSIKRVPCVSTMSLANRDIPCVPLCQLWDLSCSVA